MTRHQFTKKFGRWVRITNQHYELRKPESVLVGGKPYVLSATVRMERPGQWKAWVNTVFVIQGWNEGWYHSRNIAQLAIRDALLEKI